MNENDIICPIDNNEKTYPMQIFRTMWMLSRNCESKTQLSGKTVVITGANTGIGKETAKDLYLRGAKVILACRDLKKANDAVNEIKSTSVQSKSEKYSSGTGKLVVQQLDLKSLKNVRECAKSLHKNEEKIDILINNAGVMACPFEKTQDGFESQLQTNHLSHFLLTLLLLPKIQKAAPGSRVITVSSMAHKMGEIHFDDINLEKSYGPLKAYCQSKLANVLFAKELARRLKDAKIEGIHTYSLHPGVISTELGRHLDSFTFKGFQVIYRKMSKIIAKTPKQGSQTTIQCAVDEIAGTKTGLYYNECRVAEPSNNAKNEEIAARLWKESLRLVRLPNEENLNMLLQKISKEMSQ